ncbi:MAG: sialate O-acetylesterase [Terrimonas sp.]|nr:sialate O-acetylesterase [Terrimonas sp.]
MKDKFRLFPIFLLCLIPAAGLLANIRLPHILGNNMVLQQQSKASLWGWGDPGEKIIVSATWSQNLDSTITDSDGKWKIKINTPTAGGPYSITLKAWNTLQLENILIGEVWVCSGQSNMEWSSYNGNQQILDEMPNCTNNKIRLFHIPRTTADYPQDNCEGQWETCSPNTLKGFSAIGYFFGKKLEKELGVPIGLIMTAWGGTPVEVWTPKTVIENHAVMKEAAQQLAPTPWGPVEPGLTFNAMISPITHFEIAGAIWYQGESNTGTAYAYRKTFGAMIQSWRQIWKKNFPFYYVQIAPYNYGNKNIGALLREQQTQTLALDNTGIVVITDLVDDINNIHPANKIDVAVRLANLALGKTYGKNIAGIESPAFNHFEIKNNELHLYFDHAPNGLFIKGKAASEFYIAGEDRVFLPATVKVLQDRVILKNKMIRKPVAARFGFSNTAMPNLFSREGLPVCPFRTDDWELDTGPVNN